MQLQLHTTRARPAASRPAAPRRAPTVAMAAAAPSQPAAPPSRRLSARDCFDHMCTMLGGVGEERHTGYAGQWVTWDVTPAAAVNGPLLIDTSINIRLWRVTDPATHTLLQSNFYQTPDNMAGPSTRFAPYLSGNTMSGRPDGYGLRSWSFSPDSDMVNPDASAWLTKPGSAAGAMRVLTVPHQATTIINGAMPGGFAEGDSPRFWVLEFIVKEAASDARRWASMNWYELGELVVGRSINEDLHALQTDDLDSLAIDPGSIAFESRREGTLPGDIKDWVAASGLAEQQGTATVFAYDDQMQLTTVQRPCSWSDDVEAVAAAPEAGGVQQFAYPDWSYCRVPKSLAKLVAAGRPRAVFEAGTVLKDNSLARWLLEYDTSGDRLLRSATFETYPAPMAGRM